MPAATKRVCKSNEEDMELRRGPWTLEEDSMLIHYIACHGEGRWNMLAKCAGLKRTGKSCRLRWLNYLKPDIKRGNLTPHEQLLILDLHSKWGNRWSKIAQHLPGRTDNEIKNYWRTRVQKQARQLNIESNSKRFVDTVRCFWMPTLLQKMEQTASSPPTNSSLTSMNSQGSSAPSLGSSSSPPPRKLMPITLNHQHNENSSSSIHSSEYSMKISELQKMEQTASSPPTNSSLTSMNSQGSSVGSSSSPPPRKLMPITLNHQHNENSSSSIHSSEYSMKISEESQVPEHPADPFHAFDNCSTVYNHPNPSDCHLVDSRSFDMEAFILDPMSATDTYENSLLDCHMADGDWLSDNMANSLWNMNEIMGSSHPYRSS